MNTSYASQISIISPKGHQPIKAKIIDRDPKNFTINVESFANFGADTDASTFALYKSSVPNACADFSDLELKYDKPQKYIRIFDLSKHKNVIAAFEKYQCVVIKNLPSQTQ